MQKLRKRQTKFSWNVEIGAVQQDVNLVDFIKHSQTSVWLRKLVSVQPGESAIQSLVKVRQKIENDLERKRIRSSLSAWIRLSTWHGRIWPTSSALRPQTLCVCWKLTINFMTFLRRKDKKPKKPEAVNKNKWQRNAGSIKEAPVRWLLFLP